VFRVTDINVPAADATSEEVKKLRDTLLRSLTDEQVAQYVTKIESEIGTSINQAAFAQATGAASN
jgi:peptidyl-prolyl cis-trans isomerase D